MFLLLPVRKLFFQNVKSVFLKLTRKSLLNNVLAPLSSASPGSCFFTHWLRHTGFGIARKAHVSDPLCRSSNYQMLHHTCRRDCAGEPRGAHLANTDGFDRLTAYPTLRHGSAGLPACSLAAAVSALAGPSRQREGEGGEWSRGGSLKSVGFMVCLSGLRVLHRHAVFSPTDFVFVYL